MVRAGILTDGWVDRRCADGLIDRQTEVETNGVQAADGQINVTL